MYSITSSVTYEFKGLIQVVLNFWSVVTKIQETKNKCQCIKNYANWHLDSFITYEIETHLFIWYRSTLVRRSYSIIVTLCKEKKKKEINHDRFDTDALARRPGERFRELAFLKRWRWRDKIRANGNKSLTYSILLAETEKRSGSE